MTDRLRLVSWGMLVAPLAFFYFYFLVWSVRSGAVPPTSLIEAVVLAAMVLRLAVLMSFKRLRQARLSLVIDVFALEVLVVAALLVLYIASGTSVYLSLLTSLALAWPAALLLVFPVFALYRFAVQHAGGFQPFHRHTLRHRALCTVGDSRRGREPGCQRSGSRRYLALLLLGVLLGQERSAYLLPEVTFTGLLLYLALTFYVINSGTTGTDKLAPLLLAVAGSLVALGWSVVGSFLTDDLFLLFAAPGFVILGVIWWTTRGR